MIVNQNAKKVVSIAASVATNGTHTVLIDTLGFDNADISLCLGTAAATTAATVCKVAESDTTDATAFSDIVSATGGTATSATVGFVIPARSNTDGAETYQFNINTGGRKRYLKPSFTPGSATVTAVSATLTRAGVSPTTTTLRGVGVFVAA